jgi:hypothetical protein
MDDVHLNSKLHVRNACARLIYELGIETNKNHPYFAPYTNYVMSWCNHLPINTIIIGQNPYPQDIYPEYGAAFAYDQIKSHCPQSVYVLAKDLENYNSTDFQVSTECFRDSWKLLDLGVILINETVYDKISIDKKNTRGIREMEAQCRALQILITESYLLGQTTITCVGMGIPATSMTSVIRSWCPKDLIKMKILTCKNPATRDIGDMPSHQITIGKTAVSKVLSDIVKSYTEMAPQRSTAQEKRRQENVKALEDSAKNMSVTAGQYEGELESFEDRLHRLKGGGSDASTIDEIIQTSGALRRAIAVHKNAVMTHSITLSMVVDAIGQAQKVQDTNKNQTVSPISTVPIANRPSGARRRVSRTSSSPQVESVPEMIEPPPEPKLQPEQRPELLTPSPAPSRARRRVPSYTTSNADTEYTIVSQTPLDSDGPSDMSQVESVFVKIFADWCNSNIDDTVCYEMLCDASSSKVITSSLVKKVVLYIRHRKEENLQYDAYDELTNPDSESSVWARNNIMAVP